MEKASTFTSPLQELSKRDAKGIKIFVNCVEVKWGCWKVSDWTTLVLLQRIPPVWVNAEGKGQSDLGNFVLHQQNSNEPHEHTQSVNTEQFHFNHQPLQTKPESISVWPAETMTTTVVHGLIPRSWGKWRDWNWSKWSQQIGWVPQI